MASSYSGDPYWMQAKYPGKCSTTNCNTLIHKGERVFYYPKTKSIFVGKCAEENYQDFKSMVQDEDAYNGGY